MKQKIITATFFLLEIGCSFLAWQSLYQAVLVSGSSRFFLPSIFFSLLATFLLVSVLLFPLVLFRVLAILIIILPVFFFGWSIASFFAFGIAMMFLYRSLRVVDRELSEHLTIRFFSSARTGVFLLSLGFSVVIVAAYAALITNLPIEKLLPRFSLAEGTGRIVLQLAGQVNPSLGNLVREDLSVDEFLLEMMPKEMTGQGTDIPPSLVEQNGTQSIAFRDTLRSLSESSGMDYEQLINDQRNSQTELQKTLFLGETKRRMADILGRSVSGDERATDVLSEVVNAKIFGTLSTVHTEGSSVNTLRAVIALLLFLSLLSAGSIFGFVWAFLAWIIFWLLQGSGIVAIRRVQVEAEQVVLLD